MLLQQLLRKVASDHTAKGSECESRHAEQTRKARKSQSLPRSPYCRKVIPSCRSQAVQVPPPAIRACVWVPIEAAGENLFTYHSLRRSSPMSYWASSSTSPIVFCANFPTGLVALSYFSSFLHRLAQSPRSLSPVTFLPARGLVLRYFQGAERASPVVPIESCTLNSLHLTCMCLHDIGL